MYTDHQKAHATIAAALYKNLGYPDERAAAIALDALHEGGWLVVPPPELARAGKNVEASQLRVVAGGDGSPHVAVNDIADALEDMAASSGDDTYARAALPIRFHPLVDVAKRLHQFGDAVDHDGIRKVADMLAAAARSGAANPRLN